MAGVGRTSLFEQVKYQYWLTTLYLLKQGIPYIVIETLNTSEINIILGILSAQQQRQDAQMRR